MSLGDAPNLDDDARSFGQNVIDRYAIELLEESRRIAQRAESGSVSVPYVRQAALNLKLIRPSGVGASLLVAIGMAILAGAVGVLATVRTAAADVPNWIEPVTVTMIVVGAMAFTVGVTLQVLNRRR